MQNNSETLRVGTKVAYIGDPGITGVVVGHGTVDNSADVAAGDDNCYHVAIVRLDYGYTAIHVDGQELASSMGFHMPIDPSRLKVI